MHGFQNLHRAKTKKTIADAANKVDLIDLSRSTVKQSNVSSAVTLTLEEVIVDIEAPKAKRIETKKRKRISMKTLLKSSKGSFDEYSRRQKDNGCYCHAVVHTIRSGQSINLLCEKNKEVYYFVRKEEREKRGRETTLGYWEDCEEGEAGRTQIIATPRPNDKDSPFQPSRHSSIQSEASEAIESTATIENENEG
ncbi:unnamed protein product [Microthlaspi erraticum]|uniref:Uncharacterized protein n=1 Tax=Microthlaspi erraticum TaxID=1685480 RepID=A0A6D2HRU7_9BRAS|nr:unnamed protein product [Microthlaspi erraticum]